MIDDGAGFNMARHLTWRETIQDDKIPVLPPQRYNPARVRFYGICAILVILIGVLALSSWSDREQSIQLTPEEKAEYHRKWGAADSNPFSASMFNSAL